VNICFAKLTRLGMPFCNTVSDKFVASVVYLLIGLKLAIHFCYPTGAQVVYLFKTCHTLLPQLGRCGDQRKDTSYP